MSKNDFEVIDLPEVLTKVKDSLTFASVVEIKDESTWLKAREIRRAVALSEKIIDKHFTRIKKPWDEGKKKILDLEKEYTAPIEMLFEILDKKIVDYEEYYFNNRTKMARDLQQLALERAKEDIEAQAEELRAAGDDKGADQLLAQPIRVPQMVIPAYEGWLPGEGRSETWGIPNPEVDPDAIDIVKLCQAVVDGKVSKECVKPNLPVLGRLAKALRQTFDIPGVKARKKTGIVQR
jgi:hypothetical protein